MIAIVAGSPLEAAPSPGDSGSGEGGGAEVAECEIRVVHADARTVATRS